MLINFCKYQGVGNDFIMIDNRSNSFNRQDNVLIESLCNRRFGIGADGLILLQHAQHLDFEMLYFNADGMESSMCGNGGRCIVSFAQSLGLIQQGRTSFMAVDGIHHASIVNNDSIELQMIEVHTVEERSADYFLNTGSPHYIIFVEDVDRINVVEQGKAIRYNDEFSKEGTNVNFVQITADNQIKVRTYERGVEEETLSCGTGVTAAAIATSLKVKNAVSHFYVQTLGGPLEVKFLHQFTDNCYVDIFLIGPAVKVFEGQINILK
jgi:diaminopimelate epimerase